MCAALPPYDLWPLAPAGAAAFALLLRGRSVRAGAGLGLLTGLAFFVPALEGLRPSTPGSR
jgi:apolipoprotein N-acyltransferase